MTFTDDDLKHFKEVAKEKIGGGPSRFVGRAELAALLSRLEAAEKVVQLNLAEHHTCHHKSPCIFIEKIEAWREAAGK